MQLHLKILDKSRRLASGLELRSESVWPGLANDLFVAHASIYSFASQFVRGADVLDAGCGCGYGSEVLLRSGASSVLGVDISQRSVRYARRNFRALGLTFEVSDLQALSFEEARFGAVVSSNALEHLEEPGTFIESLSGWLEPSGLAILVVPPITNEFQLRQNQANPFHRSNLTVREWHDLFQEHGWSVQCYRHEFLPGVERLDFGALSRSSFSTEEFRFEPSSLEEMYTEPTLGAVFRLGRAPSNNRVERT